MMSGVHELTTSKLYDDDLFNFWVEIFTPNIPKPLKHKKLYFFQFSKTTVILISDFS